MFPTFSDFLAELFGINIPLPIQTFGLFMGIAFIVAAWIWGKELTRIYSIKNIQLNSKKIIVGKAATIEEYLVSGIFGFILGFKVLYIILNYKIFVADPPTELISLKGNLLGGIILSIYFIYSKYRESEKQKLPQPIEKIHLITPTEHVGNMTLIAAIFGILGAKIFHNLENLNEFSADPIGALLSFSGLTWYGGLILATSALFYYSKKNKIYFPYLMDSSAPALMIGYALGRFGCHFSGDGDWGIVNDKIKPNWLSFLPDWAWAYKYPHNVINEGVPIPDCIGAHCMQLAQSVYPTPLYEAVACTLMFFLLWFLRKKIKTTGLLFSIYLMFNGLERFGIELIRVNTTYNLLGGITQAQIISTLLFLIGLFFTIKLIFFKSETPVIS